MYYNEKEEAAAHEAELGASAQAKAEMEAKFIQEPFYDGDMEKFLKEVCKYAETFSNGKGFELMFTMKVIIKGEPGQETKVFSVEPTLPRH